uniref:hypothetical protein n=1 Tax=Bacillaceae bacterium JMAK1 TaxID=1028381 RepID=UPI0003ABF018|nr:hypothetical protein [Bacillaceae bacterium JMAK1]AGQ45470.1 hypothetical protein [Bacillaceae bacterium JMAK1]
MSAKQRKFWMNEDQWQRFCTFTDQPSDTIRELIMVYTEQQEKKEKTDAEND